MEVEHKTNFKPPRVSTKVRRRRKREARDRVERDNKGAVRARDNKHRRGCSVPLCGCRKFHLALHVAHLQHKSMGGNPKQDRSTPEKMIQTCSARHREHRIAIDQGTLQCRPLTDGGTDGPVAWWVSVDDLMNANVELSYRDGYNVVDGWLELAREVRPGVFEPFTPEQREILEFLGEMEF